MTTEPSSSLEIERKYDVDADTPLPDWSGMPGVARIGEPEPRELDARYLDTADGHLAGSLTALRRR
ncbi:MAG: adenylate cyclase, partial [Microbacterium aurum]